LLQGYVDTVLFRDVIERHAVTQVAALRWIIRHALRNPCGSFSAHKIHADLRSQGLSVAKDTVHTLIDHLTDAFDPRGRTNTGHALETAVFNELSRRGAQVAYVKTRDGY
jgi:predicted AAA+ superfamily ATPase